MRANPNPRLFCALDPSEETIATIVAWQRERAREGSGWRPVPARFLHLTLAFLGERPETDIEAIADVIARLPSEPVGGALGLSEPKPIPPRRPRMLALEVAGEEIPALQAKLAAELTALGVYEPEGRPFWPHVTALKRSRGSARAAGSRTTRGAPAAGGAAGGRGGHAFGAVRVALYRSEIRPEGSSYSRLAARELPQPGGRQKR